MPCRPPSTERCLVFCSPVLAASAFVSRGRLFELPTAGAGEEADSAMVDIVFSWRVRDGECGKIGVGDKEVHFVFPQWCL